MLGRFFKLTEDPLERRKVLFMLAVGFFMGIFNATYQVVADAIFLKRMPDQLTSAFLWAGVLGILTTSLFSFGQSRIRFSVLTTVSLLLIVGFVSLSFWALHNEYQVFDNLVVYTMYVATGPITAILLMTYWGIFGRLFDFRQSKRIISWIDSGQLLAAISAFFLFPVTSLFFDDTSNYLIVSIISVSLVTVLLILIANTFTLVKNNPKEFSQRYKVETSIVKVVKSPYGFSLTMLAMVSMMCFVFTQFSFQQLANVQYPNQGDLANFLAYFNGSVYLVSLIMQTFVNDRVLANYGLRVSLMVLPVVLLALAVGSIIIGFVFGTSATGSTSFVFFFIFIALTRWFNWMIRDSLETPVFKLFFIPIDSNFRFGIQSKVEGALNESGRLIAGAIIFALAFFALTSVLWISLLIVGATGIYFLAVNRLYAGYRGKIREKLETKDFSQEKLEFGLTSLMIRLEKALLSANSSLSIFAFKLLEKMSPKQVPVWVNTLIKHETDEVRDFAQYRMNEIKGLTVSERYILKATPSVEGKIVLNKAELGWLLSSGGEVPRNRIQQLTRSTQVEDRIYASELLLHSSKDENLSFLIELLNDNNPKVRSTAIKSASKRYNSEIIFALIENLAQIQFNNLAFDSLVIIGENALESLENAFYRAGQLASTQVKIIQIMGRIGGQKAKEFLWGKMDFPDKVLVSEVLIALGDAGFKAGVSQISRIKYAIEADISDVSWNLNAITEVGNDADGEELRRALRREIQNDIDHLYKLLAMLYDTRSIQLVKENIESGTSEGATYAVELLDIFLSEQLKQRVIPVLDDLSEEEKISRLEVLYPRAKLSNKLVLKFLINRDFTQANRWTKACALHRIGTLKLREFQIDLIAHLFNPDNLVREVSAWALFQINAEQYQEHSARLQGSIKHQLDRVILKGKQSQLMLFEKVRFFQSISVFKQLPGVTLSYLGDIAHEISLNTNEGLRLDAGNSDNFFLVYSGSVELYAKGKFAKSFGPGEFVGEMMASSGYLSAFILQPKAATILLRIPKNQVYELLADKIPLTERFIELV